MPIAFSEAVLYLALYSIIGWICEVIYCFIILKKLGNRGFLHGPYCPIYGLGAFIILGIASPIDQYPFLVFAAALVSATILEYLSAWLLESTFQIKWWDYSGERFNLHGRICLQNSLLFGVMGLAVVYLIHPAAETLMGYIPKDFHRVAASAVIAIFLIDSFYTLNALLGLSEKLKSIQAYLAELEHYNKQYKWFQANDLSGSIARLKEISQNSGTDRKLPEILDKLESAILKLNMSRLANAFPTLIPSGFRHNLIRIRETLGRHIDSYKESWQTRTCKIAKRTNRKTANGAAGATASFTIRISFYKLIWFFIIAGILGYVVETLFCFITRGVIESRQGLLYGPFSQVYGFGAVLMVLLLTPLTKKNDRWLFLGSALIGGAFEFLCSFLQEKALGSISWEYSGQAFSLGGRTCLTYMFFWGVLGLVFMKGVLPLLSRLVDRIPKRQGLIFSWIFIIVMSVNMFLSGTAVYRWSCRLQNMPPANAYEAFLDKHYTNERMKEIYPNMTMLRSQE